MGILNRIFGPVKSLRERARTHAHRTLFCYVCGDPLHPVEFDLGLCEKCTPTYIRKKRAEKAGDA